MYASPGIAEVPYGKMALTWASVVQSSQSPSRNWEIAVMTAFESLGKPQRRLRDVPLDDVLNMRNDDEFAPGSKNQKALVHLVSRWFHFLKLAPEYPAYLEYRRLAELNFDECIDRMLTARALRFFPTWEEMKAKDVTLEIARTFFISFVRNLSTLEAERRRLAMLLQTQIAHIGFLVAGQQKLSQADMTFFLAYADPTTGRGRSLYNPVQKARKVALSDSKLVEEAYADCVSATEQGPWLRYCLLTSDMNLEQLFGALGPYTPVLPFHSGLSRDRAYFTEIIIEDTEPFSWKIEEQEDAMRSRKASFSTLGTVGTAVSIGQPWISNRSYRPQFGLSGASTTITPAFDMPDVQLYMNKGYNALTSEWSARYYSPWRKRIVDTRFGVTPHSLMQDLALTHTRLGEARHAALDLQQWRLVDPESLKPLEAGDAGKKFDLKPDYQVVVYLPTGPGGDLVTKLADLKELYTKRGEMLLRPAFCEYVEPSQNMLHVPDPDVEAYIIGQLNLSRPDAKRVERAVRMCNNNARFMRMFGTPIVDDVELRLQCKLTSGAGLSSLEKTALSKF